MALDHTRRELFFGDSFSRSENIAGTRASEAGVHSLLTAEFQKLSAAINVLSVAYVMETTNLTVRLGQCVRHHQVSEKCAFLGHEWDSVPFATRNTIKFATLVESDLYMKEFFIHLTTEKEIVFSDNILTFAFSYGHRNREKMSYLNLFLRRCHESFVAQVDVQGQSLKLKKTDLARKWEI